MGTRKTAQMYVLDIHWETTKPRRRWGHFSTHATLSNAYRRLRDTLQIVGGVHAEHITAWDMQHGENNSTYVEFNAGGRTWEFHLYRDARGAKLVRKFQPLPPSP